MDAKERREVERLLRLASTAFQDGLIAIGEIRHIIAKEEPNGKRISQHVINPPRQPKQVLTE